LNAGGPQHPRDGPSWKLTAYLTWVGLGVNWLLPVAQVGGELLRARLLHKRHFSLGVSLASVVGDKTLQAMTQGLYTLIGLTLLSYRWGDRPLILGGLISAVLLTLGALGFYRVQQLGLFRLSAQVAQRLRRKSTLADLKETATTIDVAIEAMYRRRNQLFLVGVPGLIVWQWEEGVFLLRSRDRP